MNKNAFATKMLVALFCMLLETSAHAELEINGAIATENYLGVREGELFNFRNANYFELILKSKPSEQVAGLVDLELRNTNVTQVETLDQLWDRGTVEPISWRMEQAYVDVYGLFFDSAALTLDIRVGKQIVAWGEADGFNPTNHFDTFDLENPLEFKKRIGNVSIKTAWTIAEELLVLETVIAPRFLPSVLPVDLFMGPDPFSNPLMPHLPQELTQTLEQLGLEIAPLAYPSLRVETPALDISNIMLGLRLKMRFWDFDWSLSYFHGRSNMPVLRTAAANVGSDTRCPLQTSNCLLIENVQLVYPTIDTFGLDFRGSIGDIGVWGEMALFIPQTQEATFFFGNQPMASVTVIDDKPFVKWVLGAEYTFPGGVFINLQWVHGFFMEQTGHALHDYLFLVLRKSFLSDRLRGEITLGGELDSTFGNKRLGGILGGSMTYKPYDGVELALGYTMARGEKGVTLEMFEKLDMAYLKIRSDF